MESINPNFWFLLLVGPATFLAVAFRPTARNVPISRVFFGSSCVVLLAFAAILARADRQAGELLIWVILIAAWGALLGLRAGYIGQTTLAALVRAVLLVPLGGLVALDLLIAGVKASPTQSPLRLAAAEGKIDELRRLLLAAGDVNEIDSQGASALHLAVLNDQAEAVKVLLEAGADPDKAARSGVTPRGLALKRANPEIVSFFRPQVG